MPKKYDSTVARMAGNIAGTWAKQILLSDDSLSNPVILLTAKLSVKLARAIVAEVEATELMEQPAFGISK